MSKNRVEDIWLRYVESMDIEKTEGSMFAEQIDTRPELAQQVADERMIHAMLQLASETEQDRESFVSQCVKKINDGQNTKSHPSFVQNDVETVSDKNDSFESESVEIHSLPAERSKARVSRAKDSSLANSKGMYPQSNASRSTIRLMILAACLSALIIGIPSLLWIVNAAVQPNVNESSSNVPAEDNKADDVRTSIAESNNVVDPNTLPGVETPEKLVNDASRSETQPEVQPIPTPDSPTPAKSVDPIAAIPNRPDKKRPDIPGAQIDNTYPILNSIATIVDKGNLDIDDSGSNVRVGPGSKLDFERGQGVIEFDDGREIYFIAPIVAKIHDDQQFVLESGQALIDVSKRHKPLKIDLGTSQVNIDRGGRVLLNSLNDENGGQVEIHLSRGRATWESERERGKRQTIDLAPGGFNQILASQHTSARHPTILMAKGRRRFMGQVGVGDQVWETQSAPEFFQLSRGLTTSRTDLTSDSFQNRWAIAMKEMQNSATQLEAGNFQNFVRSLIPENNFQFSGDVSNDGSTSFQATITVDGKTMTFDSELEFRKMRDQLQSTGQPFDSQEKKDGSLNKTIEIMNSEFPIGDRVYQFSPVSSLEKTQRQMLNPK